MTDLNNIKKILSQFIDLSRNEVYIFGSRAKGTERSNSDLDILIVDNNFIPASEITKLIEIFEESNIPFKVDLVIRSRITDEFYKKIKNDLVKI